MESVQIAPSCHLPVKAFPQSDDSLPQLRPLGARNLVGAGCIVDGSKMAGQQILGNERRKQRSAVTHIVGKSTNEGPRFVYGDALLPPRIR